MSGDARTYEAVEASREYHQRDLDPEGKLYCQGCGDAWPCLEHLLVVEIDRLREALVWYAELKHYAPGPGEDPEWGMPLIGKDLGKRARAALMIEQPDGS